MQQYFIDQQIEEMKPVLFSKEQQHHIKRVLRMRNSDVVKVIDSTSTPYLVKLTVDEEVTGEVVERLQKNEEPIKVTLLQGMIKGERWDMLIQKACEFGVDSIVPVVSSRTVVKLNDKIDKKLERYNKIALEACEQSRRDHLVEVVTPTKFQNIENYKSELNVIAYEDADTKGESLKRLLSNYPEVKSVTILIGSEGGFSQEEVAFAIDKGYYCVSLGHRIFRAESAAWAMLQSLMFYYE
ncbi:RsmE family RNA methyltransferase [Breznakia pachnodae]|uniref:Ribosomal RNA small subunit methyltransferase E n=1 Tax=Breznakia pachnodae TaxID=265178 RepID=A0ABU0E7U2_9FIRM|nr:RsmE family RNA methyltransferase [Breznakia pachnodae]MDQ0362972.1 16S rRNA (uracil1498-N3)-methyltransferase [Breznakia pachnodae]